MNKRIKVYLRGILWQFALLAPIFILSCFCAMSLGQLQSQGRAHTRWLTSPLTPIQLQGGSPNHSQFWKFTRRTHGTHWQPLYSQLWFITGKRCRWKSGRGSEQSGGGPQAWSFQAPSPCVAMDSITPPPPAMMWDGMHGMLPSRQAHPSLSVQKFHWLLSHTTCMAHL